MDTFKIVLEQKNSKGKTTFSASCKAINVKDVSNLSNEIADFVKSYSVLIESKKKLGVSGLDSLRIKKSQPLSLSLIVDDENFAISYNSFGKLLESTSQKNLAKIFKLDIDFVTKFAHLWA